MLSPSVPPLAYSQDMDLIPAIITLAAIIVIIGIAGVPVFVQKFRSPYLGIMPVSHSPEEIIEASLRVHRTLILLVTWFAVEATLLVATTVLLIVWNPSSFWPMGIFALLMVVCVIIGIRSQIRALDEPRRTLESVVNLIKHDEQPVDRYAPRKGGMRRSLTGGNGDV